MFQDLMMHIIRFPRNWAKSYIMWNVALNQNGGPVLTGSSSTNRGLLTIRDDATDSVTYNPQYYGLGHSSKFVDPGAVRIDSNTFQDSMEDVAYKNPDGSKVVVLSNRQTSSKTVKIVWGGQAFTYTVPAEGAITFKWSGSQSQSQNQGSTTTNINTNATYRIVSRASGKCLDIEGAKSNAGANVLQWDKNGGTNQMWYVVGNSDGSYTLKSVHSGKVLDVEHASTNNGGNLIVWDSSNEDNQKWWITSLGNGYYSIISKRSGKSIDVESGSTQNGGNVIQWDYHGGNNQQWALEVVSSGSSGSSSSNVVANGEYYLVDSQGKVVCADNTGNDPLVANRSSCGGAWETLQLVNNGDGTVSFKSGANGKYVCAVIDESNQLLARSSSISTWEKFYLERLSNGNFAIKAVANGKYVCADLGKGSVLYADRSSASGWETFQIYTTSGNKVQ